MNNQEVREKREELARRAAAGDLEAQVKLDWYFGFPPATVAITREFLDRQVARLEESA